MPGIETGQDLERAVKNLSERIESNPDESLKNELAELEMALNRLAPYLPAFTKMDLLRKRLPSPDLSLKLGKISKQQASSPPPSVSSSLSNALAGENVIENLVSQEIGLPRSFESLTLRNIANCTVKCGPSKSSVYLESCRDCTIHVAGHQIRADKIDNCDLFLFSPTGLIVENSKNYRVHPYQFDYPMLPSHLKDCKLENRVNRWTEVNDFDQI